MDAPTIIEDPVLALDKIEQSHKVVRGILDGIRRSFDLNDNESAKILILKLLMTEVSHFNDEEQIMERFDYPDLSAHRAEHNQMIDALSNINRIIIPDDPRFLSKDFIDYLEKTQSHEEEEDVLLKKFLASLERQ
jgi:hemerythrin